MNDDFYQLLKKNSVFVIIVAKFSLKLVVEL